MTSEDTLVEIVVGTYEKFLLGYKLEMVEEKFKLTPSFTNEAHLQSVKCLASSNKFLASGSTDETIQLFNMKTHQELGTLLQHNGTVTSLAFHDTHLISCSEDFTLCVWSTKTWQCVKTLLGHKGVVNSVSIHPSGKLALSVSKDKTLRTWNLIKGRSAYVSNIKKVAEKVLWSPDGSHYLVSCDKTIDVYSLEAASITSVIDFEKKICDFAFVNDNMLAVGGEGENIRVYDISAEKLLIDFKAHDCRIKSLCCVSISEETFMVSASSDGCIKVWHMDLSKIDSKPRKVAKLKTGTRPTCMTVIS